MEEYIKYLRTFLIPRELTDEEVNSEMFGKAAKLGDIKLGMIFKNDKFMATARLTDRGYEFARLSWLDWIMKGIERCKKLF